jgi:hypothetical protein
MFTKRVRRLNLSLALSCVLGLAASCGDDATVDPDSNSNGQRGDGDDDDKGDGDRDDDDDDDDKGDGDDSDGDGDVKGDGDKGDGDDSSGDGDGDTTQGDGDGDETGDGDSMMTPVDPETGLLKGITRFHNEARARVPANPKLQAVSWDVAIAVLAQKYAEKLAMGCSDKLVHSLDADRCIEAASKPCKLPLGENLAAMGSTGGTSVPGSAKQAVDLWESEVNCYTYGRFQGGVNSTCTSACKDFGGCGHYTQLAWRNTKKIGCGTASCTQGTTKWSYWVCNYDPPGNFTDQFPY